MLILNVKRFIKSPVLLISTIAYIVLLYLIQPVHSVHVIYDGINSSLTTQPFSFLYFMVISYEFFYQAKSCKLEEIIYVSRLGKVREKAYGVLIFIGLDMLLCTIYFSLFVIVAVYQFKVADREWFWMLLQTIFIYHFLLYLFAILLGVLISLIYSRIRAFFALMLVFSLFSNIFLPVILECVANSERGTHIVDILGIMNRNYYVGCDFYYMYSVEAVNIQRTLFWILLAIMILCMAMGGKKRFFLEGVLLICAGVTFCFYIQPAGYRYNGGWWGTGMDDQQYYDMLFENEQTGIARQYKEADFKIQKMEGDLSAKRVLKASLDVTVDKEEQEEYCFTLYHGYKIQAVADGSGKTLPYEQDGDHVRICNPNRQMIQKIHFEYEGYSKTYVATGQAIFLPGNFPYLPQPGWKEYMSEPDESYHEAEYDLKGIGYPVEYDIRVDTKKKVYSNLKETDNSRFTGTSEAATFMACSFIRELKIGGCTYYYSMLCAPYFPEYIQETQKKIEKIMDEIAPWEHWQGKKIFDLTTAGGMGFVYCFADDHIVAAVSDMRSFYPYYLEKGEIPNIVDIMGGVEG